MAQQAKVTQCGGKPDDRGVSGGQPLGGDELHAGHGDGGKHRRRGPAQHALRDGGEYGGKFRNDTGKLPTTPQLHCFQHHKFIIRGDGGAVAENLLQFMEVIQVTVGNDIQFAVDFQAAAGVVEHLPGDVIGQRMLLMKRRVAEHSIKAERLHSGERVVPLTRGAAAVK